VSHRVAGPFDGPANRPDSRGCSSVRDLLPVRAAEAGKARAPLAPGGASRRHPKALSGGHLATKLALFSLFVRLLDSLPASASN
jgi:hypothetical protein